MLPILLANRTLYSDLSFEEGEKPQGAEVTGDEELVLLQSGAGAFLQSDDGWAILRSKSELGKGRMEENILQRWNLLVPGSLVLTPGP